MTPREPAPPRRRWRAPEADGAALIEPPLSAIEELLAENRARTFLAGAKLFGSPLCIWAASARRELVELARAYTREYRDLGASLGREAPILMAGHQPQLFHSGVWFKNFLLSALARSHSATAINLIVDNDTAANTAIRVPAGPPHSPSIEGIFFDGAGPQIPWEERQIVDQDCFDSFGERAAGRLASLVADPLLAGWWPAVRSSAARTGNLGRGIAEARHVLEGAWGLTTLELPLGVACETDSFRRFAAGMLANGARLQAVHNSLLAEYRRRNKVRSRSHPAPDLAAEGEYLEAPFWLWTCGEPFRKRLFARRVGRELEVTDRHQVRFSLPLGAEGELDAAVERLREVAAGGVRLRPRALMTTAYARLLLADLFVHGIGGGKYDELTDAILACLLEISPPAFLVASATLRLPVERPTRTADELRALDHLLRELRFHPERFAASASAEEHRLLAEKRVWISNRPQAKDARKRHLALEEINLALQPYVEAQRQQALARRQQWTSELHAANILSSREFSFCLFPEAYLREVLPRLCRP